MSDKLILPELPYAMDALDPYMSAETLEYHHGKHHKAYADKGNGLIAEKGLSDKSVEDIIVASHGKADMAGVFNNVAQFWNHVHFWQWMKPNGGGAIPGELEKQIIADFGSVDDFKNQFKTKGGGQFGSGWVWLVKGADGKLAVTSTPNGENPLIHNQTALLGCDVWEHSYYIDYRNARPKYLDAFLENLVNWDYVAELYADA